MNFKNKEKTTWLHQQPIKAVAKPVLLSSRTMYQAIRRVLFMLPAETAHYFSMNALKLLCAIGPLRKVLRTFFQPQKALPFSLFNLQFPNRVGLGAGFDKNAKYL
ncbi:MAG TPA: hypothetical protein VFT06_07360, partial [Flavisolibacter sp.]|nr:hypothetical protein [Flavisolibacter sp.]